MVTNDGHATIPSPTPNLNNTLSDRITGKWSTEEEDFAVAAIRDFNRGYLDSAPGSTLRAYLSEKLQCDPMRITKKFTGEASIGKKVFHPASRDDSKILKEIETCQAKLENLYQDYQKMISSQEQEMARKSMAAVAISNASSFYDSTGLHLFSASSSQYHGVPTRTINIQSEKAKNDVAITATWLEQAETLLSTKTENTRVQKEIEDEMKQISQLIEGAPGILAISTNLHSILSEKNNNVYKNGSTNGLQSSTHRLSSCPDLRILVSDAKSGHSKQSISTATDGKRKRSLGDDETIYDPMTLLASISSRAAPVQIDTNEDAKRTAASAKTKEAKLFVNFLQSVAQPY